MGAEARAVKVGENGPLNEAKEGQLTPEDRQGVAHPATGESREGLGGGADEPALPDQIVEHLQGSVPGAEGGEEGRDVRRGGRGGGRRGGRTHPVENLPTLIGWHEAAREARRKGVEGEGSLEIGKDGIGVDREERRDRGKGR